MATKLVYIGVAALAVLAILLGYQIYQQQTAINDLPPITQQPQNRSTPQPLINQATPAATQSSTIAQNIDINLLLNGLTKSNITQEEKDRLATDIRLAAREADVLDISGCNPNPSVLKVKKGAEFKVRNNYTVDQSIVITSQQRYNVPVNQTVTLKADFGPGIVAYRCNQQNTEPLVGIFFVE